jgi:hypothetical protein
MKKRTFYYVGWLSRESRKLRGQIGYQIKPVNKKWIKISTAGGIHVQTKGTVLSELWDAIVER